MEPGSTLRLVNYCHLNMASSVPIPTKIIITPHLVDFYTIPKRNSMPASRSIDIRTTTNHTTTLQCECRPTLQCNMGDSGWYVVRKVCRHVGPTLRKDLADG